MMRFTDYEKAYCVALVRARKYGREQGIRKNVEYGRVGYVVAFATSPERSFGSDANIERVPPNAPVCA